MRASLYVLLPSWNVCRSYLFVWLFLHHSCYLELEPHKNFQTTRTGGGYSRPTTRLVRNLLLLTMNFLRKGLEWYENGKLLGLPGFDDPETIENQCAGQWVVCLTCHHSISVLGRPETRYWEEVFTPLYLVEGLVQHMHGDWGFSIRLAIKAGSCMITPRSVYWWSLFLCHCTQEHWNRLIARVFSNGADTSPQHKQTNITSRKGADTSAKH